MELVTDYLFHRYISKQEPLPFPQYLLPENRFKNDFWITQAGECVYPWEMNDRHLLNTVRLIHRNHPAFEILYEECDADEYILYGNAPWEIHRWKKRMKKEQRYLYTQLWEEKRLYMLLRREIKLRGLEEYI
jgi:hypothetical protein